MFQAKRAVAGNSLLELAIMMPMIGMFMGGLFEYSMANGQVLALEQAARAGAQYAVYDVDDTAGITAAAQQAGNLDGVASVASEKFCKCSDGSAVACTGSCTSGLSKQTYVSVTVSKAFTPAVDFPGYDAPDNLSGAATMRVN